MQRLQICACLPWSSHFRGTNEIHTLIFFCDRNFVCGVGWPHTHGPSFWSSGQESLTPWSHDPSPLRTEITGKPHSLGFSAHAWWLVSSGCDSSFDMVIGVDKVLTQRKRKLNWGIQAFCFQWEASDQLLAAWNEIKAISCFFFFTLLRRFKLPGI